MTVESLLGNCRQRIPWLSMRNILHSKGLPVGHGWDGSIQKLLDFQQSGDTQGRQVLSLEEVYFENLLAGEKAVRLYPVVTEDIQRLKLALESVDPAQSVFSDTFPYPLPQDRLLNAGSGTSLLAVESLDESLALVFCTKRFITERNELNLADLRQETQEDLRGYDEVIAIKHNVRQFFDVILLRAEAGIVEVRIDITGGISSDDQSLAFRGIVSTFNSMVCELTGKQNFLLHPINLFPIISGLYNSDEGRVCELGFTTDEASIKLEKMRRKEYDLREETYHRAGKNAVINITPYRLGICWSFPISVDVDSKPELLLPGHFRILGMRLQFLGEAIISRCCGREDFNYVVSKILHFAPIAQLADMNDAA